MQFMINVDLERKNGGEATPCSAPAHKDLKDHYDLTVHELGSSCRRSSTKNRQKRRWEDNENKGFSREELIETIESLQAQNPGSYPRCCRRCKLVGLPADWS